MHFLLSRPARPGIAALGLFLVLVATPVAALELGAFATKSAPSDDWNTGFGGSLSGGIAGILTFEGELAYLPVASASGSFTSFTAAALVSPPLGQFSPYGGIGFGLFRQTLPGVSDTGRVHSLIVGLKWRFGQVGVLRADYREIDLSGEPLVDLERRFTVGVGISF